MTLVPLDCKSSSLTARPHRLTCVEALCSKILILHGTVYLFVVLTGTWFHFHLNNPQLNFCLLLRLLKRPEVQHIHEQTEKGFADMHHF